MAFKDAVSAQDLVNAGLSAEPNSPNFPCPKCGKETKEHRPRGMRICSATDCRQEVSQEHFNSKMN